MFFTNLHTFKLHNLIPRIITFKSKHKIVTLTLSKDILIVKIYWIHEYQLRKVQNKCSKN